MGLSWCSELGSERQRRDRGREAGGGSPGRTGAQTSLREPAPAPPPRPLFPGTHCSGPHRAFRCCPKRIRTRHRSPGVRSPHPRAAAPDFRASAATVFQRENYRKRLQGKRSPGPAAPKPGTRTRRAMSDAARSEGCECRARKITHKEKLPEDTNEGRVCVQGSSQNPPAGGAEPVKGASEGTQAAAGAAPRRDAGDGNRSQPRARGSLHAQSPRRETGRVSLGPLGHTPSAERGPRILAPAGRKQTWGTETLGPWIPESGHPRPRRATTYTKTPKSRARTPISMASSRMVRPEQLPRRLRLVLSAAPPQLGRRRLFRPGAAREARSRPRAGAGGGRPEGRAAGRAQPKPPA